MEPTRLVGYCGGSFAVGLVSGLVPVVNTEAYLLMIVALAPHGVAVPAVVFVTLGQMLAKALLYLAGTGALRSRFVSARSERLAGLERRLSTMQAGPTAVLFSSALTGIPPFYLVSIAAGSLRYSLARFLLVGGSGRLLRFAAIVALPGLLGSGAMTLRLLIDAPEFMEAVARDLAAAKRTALVQAMTFEGDAAGEAVAAAIRACPATDRRVLVDAFTQHVLSDRFRWWPHNIVSPSLWREWSATRRMIGELERGGARVRFHNPAGFCFRRFPARNHKKLVAVDGRVAYFGGINFSDHNFGWHDLMLRIEEPRIAAFLEEDFFASWEGRPRAGCVVLDGFTLRALDGRSNEAAFDEILDLVAHARDEVFLECPYVTDPFSRELERAARRGVRVRVLTPERHNFPLLREGLAHAAARSPLELRLYPGRMTHMKALLVDRRALVVGSANFDVWSYRSQQEYLAVVREPGIVAEFERRVVEPDLACSRPWPRAPQARDARGLEARLAGLALLASLGARAPEEP